jgi:hypothetical protein
MLVGWGSYGPFTGFYWGSQAVIYINATTIELRIDDQRASWNIYAHTLSTNHEIFKGINDYGRITVKISKWGYGRAHGRKVCFFGYIV